MNILIIGTGIIGTIYGWALKESGHEVTHLVRPPKPELSENGVKIDILDERKGFKKINQTTYSIELADSADSSNDFDLVIVPTNWYHTESALKGIFPKWPMWLLIPMFKFNFRHNESMKRYTAHGESMPIDDIACNYYDILKTVKEFNFEIPYFQGLEEILKQSLAA